MGPYEFLRELEVNAMPHLRSRLFLLVDGRAVYLGDAAKAVPFYQSMGFVYPEGMNPADFLSMLTCRWRISLYLVFEDVIVCLKKWRRMSRADARNSICRNVKHSHPQLLLCNHIPPLPQLVLSEAVPAMVRKWSKAPTCPELSL
jgi:hypothetical protein